jgi:hypothetical protein
MDGELMKNLREYDCVERLGMLQSWDAAIQQQFCSSRDFDSKKAAGVCFVVFGFSPGRYPEVHSRLGIP